MAVSDGVFDEGTFDSATFNNLTRSETASLNDRVATDAEFFRALSDTFNLSDADIKQLERKLSESFSANDVSSTALFRVLEENLPLNESIQTRSDLFRSFSEALSLTDLEKFAFLRSIKETPVLNDNISRVEADLFRNLTEDVELDAKPSATKVESGRFITPSTNITKDVDVGFEPDAVEFKVTSTNPDFDTVASTNGGVKISGGDFGWSHGFASFEGVIEQVAAGHGSGSASTNGHYSENSDSLCILQPVTDASGDNLNGSIKASMVSRSETGFTLDFTATYEQQYVTFTAYKFKEGDYHVGFFDSPSSTATVSVTEPGFQPNFARFITTPNLGSMNTSVNELSTGTDTVGWSEGVVVENNSGLKQGSFGVSQWSKNIDGHAFNGGENDCISLAYMDSSKDQLAGVIEANVAGFDASGFDVSFSAVNPTSTGGDDYPVIMYLAADSSSTPEAGFETTPTSAKVESYRTDFELENINFIGTNTVPDFQSQSGQSRKTWGWNYGEYTAGFQQAIGFSSNSDSVNGHAYGSSDANSYYQLFTDNNGNIVGRDVGTVQKVDNKGFEIDWTSIATSGDSGYISFDTSAFMYYGFEREAPSLGSTVRLDKKVGEALGLNDTVVSVTDLFRAFSQTVQVNDSDLKQFDKLLTETVVSSDSVDTESQLFRSFTEALNISDDLAVSVLRSLQESIVLNDSLDKSILISFSESVSPQDSFDKVSNHFRNFSEDLKVNDNVQAIIIVRQVLTESLSLSDTVSREAGLIVSLTEDVSLGDSVSSTAELFRTVNQSLGLTDDETAYVKKVLTGQVGLNDKDVELLLKTVLSEQIPLGESVDVTAEFFRNIDEFVQLNDSDIKGLARRLTEVLNVNDNQELTKNQFRSFAESIVLSDNSEKRMFKALVEVVGLVEEVNTSAELFRDFTEFVDLQDELVKSIAQDLDEQVALGTSLSPVATYRRSFDESMSLLDSVFADITLISRTLSESVLLNDSAASKNIVERILNEQFSVSDSVDTRKTIFRDFEETVSVQTRLSKQVGKALTENLSLNITAGSLKQADAVATTVEINKLQKAVTNLAAARKAVAELEKDTVSNSELDKF